MGGFFLRPKDTNNDTANSHINAEAIGVVALYENEYIDVTGTHDPAVFATRAARHNKDPKRREAPRSNPLPSGNWRGGGTRTGRIGNGRS